MNTGRYAYETAARPTFAAGLERAVDYYTQNPQVRSVETRPAAGQGRAEHVLERMYGNYALIEEIDPSPAQSDTQPPLLSATMPVAVLHESFDTVAKAVEVLSLESRRSNAAVDLLIWANTQHTDWHPAPPQQAHAKAAYSYLRERLARIAGHGLHIRTALQIGGRKQLSMSRLRANYMEAVAVDALERGLGYDLPVLWLDADLNYLQRGSLQRIAEHVRSFRSYFTHAQTQYSLEWAAGRPLDTLDDATKAVAINEIMRRQFARQGMYGGYDEESGLAFALGTYLRSGGIDTRSPFCEAATLLGEAKLDGIRPDYELFRTTDIRVHGLNGLEYVPATRLGISGRRHYDLVRRYGAGRLHDPDGGGYTGPYSTTAKASQDGDEAAPIVRQDLLRLAELQAQTVRDEAVTHAYNATRAEHVVRATRHLIDRYFGETATS